MKLLAAGRELGQGHTRVLMMDDTVYIKESAPDVFEECPPDAIACGYPEGIAGSSVPRSETTWQEDNAFLQGARLWISPVHVHACTRCTYACP